MGVRSEPEYDAFFRFVVRMGIVCGLDHPVGWAVQAHRTPGGTLSPEYYAWVEGFLPRFLVEAYEMCRCADPPNADAVLEMCDAHFADNPFGQGYFAPLRDDIQRFLEARPKDGSAS